METKLCKKCNEVKPIGEFHKDKGMKDGYKNYCRDCYKNKIYSYGEKKGEENRKPYEKIGYKGFIHKAKPIIIIGEVEGKECNRCGNWKPLTEYHRFRRLAYGLNLYCKECDIAAKLKYFRTPRGKNTAHRAAAKRRATKKGVKYTRHDRAYILKRDKYTCQKCGIKVHDRSTGDWNTPDKAHVDHIISLEDGGTWEYSNLRTLCRTCNLEKGAKSEGVMQLALF